MHTFALVTVLVITQKNGAPFIGKKNQNLIRHRFQVSDISILDTCLFVGFPRLDMCDSFHKYKYK